MSKRLKLDKLKLLSNSLIDKKKQKTTTTSNENKNENEVVSKFFVAEILEPKKKTTLQKPIKIKYDEDIVDDDDDDDKTTDNKWEPNNWKETYELIKEMRKNNTAPVDEMGCDKCSEKDASPEIYRYQCLLALMLSSQTKDQVTHAAMERLKNHGCKPDIIVSTPDDDLGKLIYPVGFWKRKVQYIKKTSEILIRDYQSDIPSTIEDLCKLPGVGPKMGHICMQIAWNKTSGIGVDTHVHRICNRLAWLKNETKTPEDTRKQLESWLPKKLWSEVNHLLVGFGQEICLPRGPKCKECLNNKICPFPRANK